MATSVSSPHGISGPWGAQRYQNSRFQDATKNCPSCNQQIKAHHNHHCCRHRHHRHHHDHQCIIQLWKHATCKVYPDSIFQDAHGAVSQNISQLYPRHFKHWPRTYVTSQMSDVWCPAKYCITYLLPYLLPIFHNCTVPIEKTYFGHICYISDVWCLILHNIAKHICCQCFTTVPSPFQTPTTDICYISDVWSYTMLQNTNIAICKHHICLILQNIAITSVAMFAIW